MNVFHDAASAARALPGSCLTVGNYDGIHLGHRAVLAELRSLAQELAAPTLAVTFRPHPAEVLSDSGAPARLASEAQLRELLGAVGVGGLLLQPFDADFARLGAEGFVQEFLRDALGARGVVVGDDFRFGARRAGDLALLEALAARDQGPRVVGVRAVVVDGERVSSSRLRDLVRAGQVEQVEAGLGRPFVVEGRVVQGDGRGRQLGFPTANVEPREVMIPGPGVYACVLHRDDDLLPAVTNVGRRPTFGGRPIGIEAHVLDFDGNLYGARVRVAFLGRLRAEQRFASAEELVTQVGRDVEAARAVLAVRPPESLRGVPGC